MKPGPRAKPLRLKVLHGAKPPPPPLPGRASLPVRPDYLSAEAAEVWDALVAELAAMRVLSAADAPALGVLCQAVAHHQAACRLVNDSRVLIRNREGLVVKNPALQIIRDQAAIIRALASEFGCTPSARSSLSAGPEEMPAGRLDPARLLS